MRIGIIFGGQSREREISFAGGRTVYDNLNKALFTPVPIFIDSLGNFILLNWECLYKGTIRDFYPSANHLPDSPHFFQIYAESLAQSPDAIAASIEEIGQKIEPSALSDYIDFAFLTLHGPYGEDGNIQGILEWYGIPYSGAGILPSSIGIDKEIQKHYLQTADFETPDYVMVSRSDWQQAPSAVLKKVKTSFQFPLVIKAPHQGSSIGVSIARDDVSLLEGLNRSFFIQHIRIADWKKKSDFAKRAFLMAFTDIRTGLGFPVNCEGNWIYHPEDLWRLLDQSDQEQIQLEARDGESAVLIESFVAGKEFSCIVIENVDGQPVALPPTEIKKSDDLFDYRSKYLPGISRKITPIDLEDSAIEKIRSRSTALFKALNSQVYARLDGFYTADGQIFLNDPNTTSGMLPSSFFFHQAAEIGLNPSQFLTYIIDRSILARIKTGKQLFKTQHLYQKLTEALTEVAGHLQEKIKVAVIMGGFSSERHISVESGRNIYEKLASSSKYLPIPIFLTGTEEAHELYQLPINVMLKDNADDIREKIHHFASTQHEVIERIKEQTQELRSKFAFEEALKLETLDYDQLAHKVDFAFIALHGRPGEDGAIQEQLNQRGIPFNGSDVESSQTSINKFDTNARLRQNGVLVANHMLVHLADFQNDSKACLDEIESKFKYPFIAKPADDGCSSAVKKLKSREELMAFCEMMFRKNPEFPAQPSQVLKLKLKEEFPQKPYFLIEDLIEANGAEKFMEITGGMLTRMQEDGSITFEIFEPSEALASGEILSLEEKFLAGEGQNITPARFASPSHDYQTVAITVKRELEKTARLIGIEGYCRIDAFVRIYPDRIETIIIEINSLPGMTPATAIFHQAALQGMKPYDFIDQIIEYGFARHQFVKQQIN